MLKGVLFDFDGTLADSFEAIAESVNFVRVENRLPELRFEEIKAHVGHGLEHLMEKMLPGCDIEQAKKANGYVPILFAVSPFAAIRSAPTRTTSTKPAAITDGPAPSTTIA